MGVSFEIGKRFIVNYSDEEGPYYNIETVTDENAPTISGAPSGKINYLSMSYLVYFDFIKRVGLVDLFTSELAQCPAGWCKLANHHAQIVHQALQNYRTAHPGIEPAYCSCGSWMHEGKACICGATEETATLARLVWFDFWMIRALELLPEPYLYKQ
jgi:hypothetical protein